MGSKKSTRWWLPLLLGLAGCNQQDIECLARIGGKVMSRSEALTGDLRQKLGDDWVPLQKGPLLAQRISVRLTSDKGLIGAAIEVKANDQVVELTGTVGDDDQRRRAVELAESTVGVEQVVDSLQIDSPPQ